MELLDISNWHCIFVVFLMVIGSLINPRPAGPLDFPPPAGGGAFERPPPPHDLGSWSP